MFGGGSFGTAMAASLAKQKDDMQVVLLLRDQSLCDDINNLHCNSRYLPVRLTDSWGHIPSLSLGQWLGSKPGIMSLNLGAAGM